MSTQRVPAWKRLGLKLKGPASEEASPSLRGPNAGTQPSAQLPNAHNARLNGSPASALKRKLPTSASGPNAISARTPSKKPRTEGHASADQGTPSSTKKSVSFADGTKDNAKGKDKPSDAAKPKPKKPKAKAKKTKDTPKTDTNLEPSLDYLRQWHTARESWKFNKNHQTLLIKYIFDGDKIPSSDVSTFYEYIRDLKGFVRTRLRETAAEIQKKDMEDGAGAFPASIKDKEAKQREYHEAISRFLQDLQQHQKLRNGSVTNANGKRALEEVEYVLRVATPEVKQRLLKRMRAETILDELSDSEESTTSAVSRTTTATTSSSGQDEPLASADIDGTRRLDGSQQPAKRRRLRNVRTDIADDDSSSSESESSESESEDSSSSSDESDDDMDVDVAFDGNPAESSSSSSSSSSEAGSESEGESDEESESGSSSSDEE